MWAVHTCPLELAFGTWTLIASQDDLLAITFESQVNERHRHWLQRWLGDHRLVNQVNPPLSSTVEQLDSYFAGELREFSLPLQLLGTEYQQRVWRSVATIPYGSTVSYRSIAEELNSSARAVGTANGANPLPVIIPCHRVVAADGSLQGYAGGLDLKERLLRHEGVLEQQLGTAGQPRLFDDH